MRHFTYLLFVPKAAKLGEMQNLEPQYVIAAAKNSRVYLFESKGLMLIKVWKGYRDALIALRGQHLMMYLPKRDILEIYNTGEGFKREK
mmetsp:Transcript_16122/g.11639  ORF Transcript_16122/g.11639 Transcript_16122/m.11639 type:complete len:89 (+) Transcript_16122:208-474(+)